MRIAIIFFICLLITFPVVADNTATFITHTENGCELIQSEGFKDPGHNYGHLDDPSIMWSNWVEWPIYTTTVNTNGGYTFAGTYLNDPREAELFDPQSTGTPMWTYTGWEFYVDASDDGFVLGAIDEDAAGIDVIKWTGPGNGTPDWSTNFPGTYVGGYGPYIEVSRDGSTIAAAITENSETRLLMFDQASSTPVVDYLAAGRSFPRCFALSSDGRYAGIRTNTWAVIYDRDLNAVRDEISIGYGSTPFDLSGDASHLAYGWYSLIVHEWNGVNYGQLWTHTESGYYLGCVGISEDGSTLVAGWYNSAHTTARITVHIDYTSIPAWTYDYATSSGACQESIRDIEMSDDGRWIIIGSWGDAGNINPEVHVFDRDVGATPYFTADMPGSVLSVDIEADGRYASACGKHVHANVSGHGGDIIAIDMDLGGSDIEVTLTPYNPPIVIPSGGGSFDFNAQIENTGTSAQTFDVWIMVEAIGIGWVGPLFAVYDFTLSGGIAIERDRTQVVPGHINSGTYRYELRAGDYPDDIWAYDNFTFEKSGPGEGLSIEEWTNFGEEYNMVEKGNTPTEFALLTACPNPFNPTTTIRFGLPVASRVKLEIYDIIGRRVEVGLAPTRTYQPGYHEVTFDASHLPSGVYFAKLSACAGTQTQKLLLVK